MRTLLSPGVSLRPGSLAFDPDTPRATPFNSASDAFRLRPDVASRGPSTLRSVVTEIAYERIGAGKTKNGFSEDVTEFPTLSSLTELYCGNGNHTCSLAPYFDEVSAVEIDPRLCAAAA